MRGDYTTKTIYIKAEDKQLYAEAAKLGDSLSSVIADALREHIGRHYVESLQRRGE